MMEIPIEIVWMHAAYLCELLKRLQETKQIVIRLCVLHAKSLLVWNWPKVGWDSWTKKWNVMVGVPRIFQKGQLLRQCATQAGDFQVPEGLNC